MPFEIERKFLVVGDGWQKLTTGTTLIRQAYLPSDGSLSIRVRIKNSQAAMLTIKSRDAELRRLEFEYPIPVQDAEALMARRRGGVVEKVRHDVPWKGLVWEVDAFTGDNDGLVIAEVELRYEDQDIDLPEWVGAEVTSQRKYYNGNLAQRPYRSWGTGSVGNVA
jgi:adenylate cyclase